VYYGTTSPPTTSTDILNDTTYTLTGLTNGQRYYVAVSAVSQALYYIAVTAYDTSGETQVPGQAHESAYSTETHAGSGDIKESGLSNIENEFPEATTPYPDLPNSKKGCFIATAAFGFYGAPEVRALRSFRDHYLLTNSMGSAFVGWYYRVSPAMADYLNAHPGYKPAIRLALLPLVGLALFLTKTTLLVKIALFVLAGCALLYLIRKPVPGPGGIQ
jgi:hypothetical protein